MSEIEKCFMAVWRIYRMEKNAIYYTSPSFFLRWKRNANMIFNSFLHSAVEQNGKKYIYSQKHSAGREKSSGKNVQTTSAITIRILYMLYRYVFSANVLTLTY